MTCDHEAQIRDLLEEREELFAEIRRLRMGNHPAGRALLREAASALCSCRGCVGHKFDCPAPALLDRADALAEALTERDAEHEGGEGA